MKQKPTATSATRLRSSAASTKLFPVADVISTSHRIAKTEFVVNASPGQRMQFDLLYICSKLKIGTLGAFYNAVILMDVIFLCLVFYI